MRIAMQCAAIVAALSLGTQATAQTRKTDRTVRKEETVVIRNDGSAKTEIEIRDGGVFVNGDEVASLKDGADQNLRKKIIVENGAAGSGKSPAWRDSEPESAESRAALGVMTDPASPKAGAHVKGVSPGSAADKAGLRKGDLITAVDDRSIASAADLVTAIGEEHKPGDEVVVRYLRDGVARESKAKLGEAGPRTAMRSFRFGPGGGMDLPGMPNGMLRSFPFIAADEAVAPKLGLSAEDRADGVGVRVLSVKPGSAAAAAGLREGDVVTQVDAEAIGSVDELQLSVRSHKPGDRLELQYERAGKPAKASVSLPRELKRRDL